MNKIKSLIYLILIALILVVVFSVFNSSSSPSDKPDIHYGTYKVDGENIILKDGIYEADIPGSSAKNTIKYFGNDAVVDLDKDGTEDLAFLITKQSGGSGVFYYLVAKLNKSSGSVGSEAVFIGDRIAPQTTSVDANNIIVVNYADRAQGESFATPPSVGKSLYLKLDLNTMQFGEVVKDFEGEADVNKMTLDMKKWVWKENDKFTITFKKDGTFSASTDCNGIGGEYTVKGSAISFKDMMSTLMYCEGSKESYFRDILTQANSFKFTSKGELIIDTGKTSSPLILN